MTTYETISLLIAFGMLIITLLAYLDREDEHKKITAPDLAGRNGQLI